MKKRTRRLTNRLYTGLITLLGFASPLMLTACYAPPQSELRYMDDEEVVVDSVEEVVTDDNEAVVVDEDDNSAEE